MLSKIIFVLGCPASGKGTICSRLVADYPLIFKHLSAGDLLRRERDNGSSEIGKTIQDCISQGKIVPSTITAGLLFEEIESNKNLEKTIYLIDGYPRNQENFDAWKIYADKVEFVGCLNFTCGFEIMKERIIQRVAETKAKGNKVRTDDNEEVMKKRYAGHIKDTLPVVEYFKKDSLCWEIDAEKDKEAVYASVLQILKSSQQVKF